MLLVALILTAVTIIFLVLALLKFEFANKNNRHLVFAGLAFPIITKAITDFLILIGFWILLDNE